jgi:ABC-type Fe3+-hydroxamate transport system substrate-binding protein
MEGINADAMKQYVSSLTKRRANTLKLMGKDHAALTAFFDTEMGQELFGWLQGKHEELLTKIANIEADDKAKIAYGLVHEWLLYWSERYDRYLKALKGIERTVEEENRRHAII